MIDSSSSSPPMRMLWLVTIPAEGDHGHLGGAAADVDHHVPAGSCTGRPTPIAAAIGSSMMKALRAPAR